MSAMASDFAREIYQKHQKQTGVLFLDNLLSTLEASKSSIYFVHFYTHIERMCISLNSYDFLEILSTVAVWLELIFYCDRVWNLMKELTTHVNKDCLNNLENGWTRAVPIQWRRWKLLKTKFCVTKTILDCNYYAHLLNCDARS